MSPGYAEKEIHISKTCKWTFYTYGVEREKSNIHVFEDISKTLNSMKSLVDLLNSLKTLKLCDGCGTTETYKELNVDKENDISWWRRNGQEESQALLRTLQSRKTVAESKKKMKEPERTSPTESERKNQLLAHTFVLTPKLQERATLFLLVLKTAAPKVKYDEEKWKQSVGVAAAVCLCNSKQYYPDNANAVPKNRLFGQFHTPQTDEMKEEILYQLTSPNSTIRVVFATVAMGMGVDIPSIHQIDVAAYTMKICNTVFIQVNNIDILCKVNLLGANHSKVKLHIPVSTMYDNSDCLQEEPEVDDRVADPIACVLLDLTDPVISEEIQSTLNAMKVCTRPRWDETGSGYKGLPTANGIHITFIGGGSNEGHWQGTSLTQIRPDDCSVVHIAVSFNETWAKRGFTSLTGVVFVISVYTEMFWATIVYLYHARNAPSFKDDAQFPEWQVQQLASCECNINFDVSSPGIECEGAVTL
ncbi:Hypothetical predicted protein [Paramuricea clavata]|uniref:Uncharacterized protein n=1 Tax=Paramuricea clavata TaxID=317549 RepID=A0A6S7FYP2_PARCT|nr:Hypothetical predicted protein [Paramuricea clavata]